MATQSKTTTQSKTAPQSRSNKKQESALTEDARREAHNWERVPYFARKPDGLSKTETHFVVTLNGKNYRYAYNTELMIPRCVRDILDNGARMRDKAEQRSQALQMKAGSGINLGTY